MSNENYIFEITEENFDRIVIDGSRSVPVLVDFWADWCQPCKMLMPTLARLAEAYAGKFILAKLNTEQQQALAAQFGIRSIPTVKLFKDGQMVDEFMGALPEAEIRAFLDRHIPRESDSLVAQANQLVQQGDTEQAVRIIEQARSDDPDNPRVLIASARLKATLGDIDGAEAELKALPMDEQDKPEVKALQARFLFDRVALDAPPAAELQGRLDEDPADSEARYQLAAHRVMDNDFEQALELLLQLLQQDRKFGDDAGRLGMLALFDILGNDNELVKRYRSRMFNALH